jgi:hypothetical protein
MTLLFALLFALPLAAQEDDLINPDRPGIADGSQTIGRGQFQIEIGGQSEHDDDGRLFTTPALLRYGMTQSFELRVEGNGYARVDRHDGFAPASIGFKYHFNDKPSLGVIARVFPPSGSGIFKSEKTTGDLRLAADVDLGEKWALNPNIGVARTEDSTDALAAVTLQYNASKKSNVFVDAGLESSNLILDTGAAWVIGRDLQLDISIGWGAHGDDVPRVFVSAGVSRRF